VSAIRIGTRGSQLALWQARTVAGLLHTRGATLEIITIKTAGDRLQERPLEEGASSTKGVFVKEIEDALLSGAIDVAVHSAKDMSALLPDGLVVAAVLPREDSRDALVVRGPGTGDGGPGEERRIREVIAGLGTSPRIGTSSVRRSAQLARLIPGARVAPVRGNVDTRLRKLDAGEFDAIVLAVAGMKRLGFASRISAPIPHADCIPAPGQGIVAIETRDGDRATRALVESIGDREAAACFEAERTLVAALGGGCQLPLGAIAVHAGADLAMQAIVTSVDGSRVITRDGRGDAGRPAELGRRIADELAKAGATAILDEVR
jgi:hydroxymethylbilane synthase